MLELMVYMCVLGWAVAARSALGCFNLSLSMQLEKRAHGEAGAAQVHATA